MTAPIEMNNAFFQDKLEKEKNTLTHRINQYESEIKTSQTNASADDIASDYEVRAKLKGLQQIDQKRLSDVLGAIRRMNSGEYGECQTCFDDINPKRLESNPAALNCIECQSKIDLKGKHFR